MVAGIAVIGLFAIAAAGWWHPWVPGTEPMVPARTELTLPARPSIAVLAFEDHSVGQDKEYLSDAIAEGIITELSRFSELFVIARNSSFHYRDKATDVREIARELGVRYVLEGSQQKAGNRLRVNVQLIDAIDGKHLWATTYDRDLADIFRVQDEIAASAASTLGEKLTMIASEDPKRAGPGELSAFEHWIRGRRHFNRFTREGSEQARIAYSAAIEADPKLAHGYSGMAWVHINGYRWGWTELERVDALSRARQAAQKALDLAPYDYVPHFTMAAVHMQAGEREKAVAEFERALELNPNSGDVMANFAELLGYEGRFREAIDLLRRAMRLDPHHPEWFHWNLGWAQYSLGDCRDGLATMRKMSRTPPFANRTLAAIHVCLGEPDQARAAISALLDHDPDYSIAKFRLNFSGKYRDPAHLEGWIEDLRLAGLRE
jgi:adenylate cyclase